MGDDKKTNVAYYGISPFQATGYGVCTKYMLDELVKMGDKNVTCYAFNGLIKTVLQHYTKVDDETIYKTPIIGGTGHLIHPELIGAAQAYDYIISHFDLWMISKQVRLYDGCPMIHWGIIDQAPLNVRFQEMMKVPNLEMVVPMTEFGDETLRSCDEVPNYKIGNIIPHGVDLDVWYKDKIEEGMFPQLQDRDVIIMSMSTNFDTREGVPSLIQAFGKFCSERPELDAAMYINDLSAKGLGHGFDCNEIMSQVDKIYGTDVAARIFYKESTIPYPEEIIRKLYSISDFQILANGGGSFEIPLLEAAACGIPSATTDATGMGSVIDHGKRGLAFSKPYTEVWQNLTSGRFFMPTIDSICEAMHTYTDDKKLRKKHVSKMMRWIRKEATWNVVGKKWQKQLEEFEDYIGVNKIGDKK